MARFRHSRAAAWSPMYRRVWVLACRIQILRSRREPASETRARAGSIAFWASSSLAIAFSGDPGRRATPSLSRMSANSRYRSILSGCMGATRSRLSAALARKADSSRVCPTSFSSW